MIFKKYDKIVPLKKLHNMKSKITNAASNDLLTIVQMLQETYRKFTDSN